MHEQDIWDRFIISAVLSADGILEDRLRIYVVKVEGDNSFQTGYLLEYNMETKQLDWLDPFVQMALMPNFTVSENGRFLQVTELKEGVQTLHLLDLETDELQSYRVSNVLNRQRVDWSNDGEWLVVAGDESLHLIAPLAKYEREVFYEGGNCNTAVWVN